MIMMILNKLKTLVLLVALSGLLLALGSALGGPQGLTLAFFLALFLNGIMYFFSDTIVLGLYGARPLPHEHYAWIYQMVQDLCHTMHLPMPRLWIVDTPIANAFATGRSPSRSSVALTQTIIDILTQEELRAVLAHELSHIKNRDTLVTTIAATLATAIGYCASMVQHLAFYQAVSGKQRGKNGFLGSMLIAIFMPFIALIIRLGISRSREYLADETGAHACKDSLALARALSKLEAHTQVSSLNPGDAARANTAGLFIVHPFTSKDVFELFSTHPSMKKRVEKLHRIYETRGY